MKLFKIRQLCIWGSISQLFDYLYRKTMILLWPGQDKDLIIKVILLEIGSTSYIFYQNSLQADAPVRNI